jgi:glutamate-1-semialdehyde 2,1-aminomutase
LVSYHPTREEIRLAAGQPAPVGEGQSPHPDVLIAEWNDPAGVKEVFERHPGEIAALICEPLLCNSGCIPPQPGFLEFLSEVTRQNGPCSLLTR